MATAIIKGVSGIMDNKRKIAITFPDILAAVTLPLMLFITVPIEIYSGNVGEFAFSISQFLPVSFALFIIAVVCILAVFTFLPLKWRRFLQGMLIGGAFIFFIQELFLNGRLNSLIGDNINAETFSRSDMAVNAAIWVAVIIGFGVLDFRFRESDLAPYIGAVICLAVTGSSLISSAVGIINSSEYDYHGNACELLSTDNMTLLSSESNIFIFVIDQFDNDYALLALEEYPSVYDELTGFTWFTDNVSRYNHTFPSICNMITGVDWDPYSSRIENFKAAYSSSENLKYLSNNDFLINIYTEDFYGYSEYAPLPDYISNTVQAGNMVLSSAGNAVKLSVRMSELAMYRGFPLALKTLFADIDSSHCNQYLTMDTVLENAYQPENKAVLTYISENGFSFTDRNVFSFLHITGCHNCYDEEGNSAGFVSNDPAGAVKYSFEIVNAYLREMKKSGIYENATIIITGDHSTVLSADSRRTALFVKPAGLSSGQVVVSDAQVINCQMWPTIYASEQMANYPVSDYKSYFETDSGIDYERRVVEYIDGSDIKISEYLYVGDSNIPENKVMVDEYFTGRSENLI